MKNLKPQTSNPKPSESGLSLIEAVVYFAVIAVVVTITLSLITNMIYISERNRVVKEVQDNMQFASSRFSQEMRKSKCITKPTIASNNTTDADVRNNTTCGSATEQVLFRVSGNKFEICVDDTTPTDTDCDETYYALTSDRVIVSSPSFTVTESSSAKPTLKMTITVEYNNPNNLPLLEYTLTANVNAAIQQ